METKCHNCKHRNDPNRLQRCLKCRKADDESYHGKVVHLNGRDIAQKTQAGSRYVTDLPNDIEDKLREAMCSLFGLDPIELLLVHHLINGGRLSSFGDRLAKVASRIGRYRGSQRAQAHAMKEAIGRKMPTIAIVINAKAVVDEAQMDEPLGDLFENAGLPLD